MAVPAFAPLLLVEREVKKRPLLTSDPDSDLTAIASSSSSSRKRRRPTPPAALPPADCEVDSLLRRYSEQLKSGIEEIHRRHLELLAMAVAGRLREREAQAERLWVENAALQEKLQSVSLQNQQLFAAARRSEAVAVALKASLEAVIRQNEAAAREREGYGDSGELQDVDSCCGGEAAMSAADVWRYRCRVCGNREVSMMLLPCQHLCLCGVCEAVAGDCPSCLQPKRGAVQVLL